MTERLYYTEPYRTEFEATVVALEQEEGRTIALLDRTAFYPTSGGQPHDVGTLGEARVIDVFEREDGQIAHVIDGTLGAGQTVRGAIDWARRFDHMQQHTGQHVLSAAFDRLLSAPTVSFHLGNAVSTIDLAIEVGAEAIADAEAQANQIVWEDRPVSIRFAGAEEAAALPLRKEATRAGPLRLIEIEGFDLSACGGTHLARTGAIGLIAVSSWERFKGGVRVGFVCGGRALQSYRTLRDAVTSSVRLLSVLPEELSDAIERAQVDNRDLKRTIRGLQERLARHEASALIAGATMESGRALVVQAVEGWDASGLKALAAAAVEQPGIVIALVSTAAQRPIVIARSKAVSIDVASVLRAIADRFGGKGGGRPELAQGGGMNAAPETIVTVTRDLLKQAIEDELK